jgi:hypothetical protein
MPQRQLTTNRKTTEKRSTRGLARSLRREDGLTVVEVVVAAMIMIIGGLAVLQLVDAAARNNYRSEQTQVADNRMQEEIEKIKEIPYDELALTGLPQDQSDITDPRWRTQGTNYAVTKQGGTPQPLIYNGTSLDSGGTVSGGVIDPAPTPFTSGDVHGTIYRSVVWENDPSCSEAQCPGNQDLKRVIVAVRADVTGSGGSRPYQEFQTKVVDPNARTPTGVPCPAASCSGAPKPWTFFLTDTSCHQSSRQPITGEHATHNTRGACTVAGSDNQHTGNTPGSPDLMYPSAPVLDPESPLYDYANDVEPPVDPLDDKGLQMLPQSSAGCAIDSLGVSVGDLLGDQKWRKVHRWLSQPMPGGVDIQLLGGPDNYLDLWTQTVNGVAYSGKICFWLFERHTNILGIPIDTPAVNLDPPLLNATYFTYSQSTWPTTWTELHIPINFSLNLHLLPNSRLGLAIAIDRSGTGDGTQGLQFMYDEPSFDSRLELKTNSLLPSL